MIPSPAVISKSATVTTSSTMSVTLANDGATFWFCSGFEISGGGATAGSVVKATITGLLGGTLNYSFPVPTGVTVAAAPMVIPFLPGLASQDASTDVVLTVPGFGAGNTGASVVIHGYKGARQLNA